MIDSSEWGRIRKFYGLPSHIFYASKGFLSCRVCFIPATFCLFLLVNANAVLAQTEVSGDELQRFTGTWKIVELIENGQSVSLDHIQNYLPSGGHIEVIDNTMLFQSKVDGGKQAKVFSIDPTVYPATISISNRDKPEGWGIYRFEGERLIICMADPSIAPRPTDFTCRAGSNRMMMVLVPDQVNRPTSTASRPIMTSTPPQFAPTTVTSAPPAQPVNLTPPPAQPVAAASAPAATATPAPATSTPGAGNITVNVDLNAKSLEPKEPTEVALPSPPVATVARPVSNPAALVLTDADMRTMLIGSWRMNDGIGVLQFNMQPDGSFQTYREVANASTFHAVFYPSPVSTGTWRVANGQLVLQVTSSTLAERVNQTFACPVRSVSATDLIIIDFTGRVVQAKKLL